MGNPPTSIFENFRDFPSQCKENAVKTSGIDIDLFSFGKIELEQKLVNKANEICGPAISVNVFRSFTWKILVILCKRGNAKVQPPQLSCSFGSWMYLEVALSFRSEKNILGFIDSLSSF